MQQLSSAPNHVGSAHDRQTAEFLLGEFRRWGEANDYARMTAEALRRYADRVDLAIADLPREPLPPARDSTARRRADWPVVAARR